MKVFVEISGGFAGLLINGVIDTETLSAPLKNDLEKVFAGLAPQDNITDKAYCDAETYRIRLEHTGSDKQISITVPSTDSQLDQILNQLKLEILQRKRIKDNSI